MHLQGQALALLLFSIMVLAGAAPVPRKRETHDNQNALAKLKAGLIASFQLAYSGELEQVNFTMYEKICQFVDLTSKLLLVKNGSSVASLDSLSMDSLLTVARIVKEDTCKWVQSTTGDILADDEGNCSDSKLEEFCNRILLYRTTKDAYESVRHYRTGSVRVCNWVQDVLQLNPQFNNFLTLLEC